MFEATEVLIVEDSPTQAMKLQALLEAAGCKVRSARNGAEALEQIAERLPTLVITDIVMPEMDGYALCRELKSVDHTSSIPVILITNLSDPRDVLHGLASGADNFIVKPFDEKDLINRIRYFIANLELRSRDRVQMGLEIVLEGERHFITAERQQILDLLISTYEQGVRLNRELNNKHAELTHNNLILDYLFSFASQLSNTRSEEAVIDAALRHIVGFPRVAGVWLLLFDSVEAKSARMAGTCGTVPERMDKNFAACMKRCPCLHIAGTSQPVPGCNVTDCPALGNEQGEKAHASIPLLLGDETIGVLNVLQRDGRHWPDDALEALGAVGRQLAMALGRARLFESMEREIQQRTEALGQSESLLRSILDHLPVGVLVADHNGRLVMSNQESNRIWNSDQPLRQAGTEPSRYSPIDGEAEPVGKDWPLLDAARRGIVSLNQTRDITALDGTLKTVQASAVPLPERQGLPQGAIVVFQDITDQRQRDLDMRIRNRAVESSYDAIFITDHQQPSQPIIYVNPAFERITGYASDEVLGCNYGLLLADDVEQPEYSSILQAYREQLEGTAVLANYRKDGSRFWGDLRISPVTTDRGAVSHYVGILRDITEEKRYQEELEHQANHDSLTGLPNRNLLSDRLQQAVAQARRTGNPFTVAFLDLDHFKVVNDSLGHNAGDRLLITIAERLLACTREDDTVARLGGDEFVIIQPDSRPSAAQASWLERPMERVSEPLVIDGNELVVGCSIGLCCFPGDGESAEALLQKADTAMYRAKAEGRNRICAFTPEMNRQIQKRLVMEQQIRHALHVGELFAVYQPQLDLVSGRLCGFEALVRWRRENQVVPPDEFIFMAEETGQIVDVDFYVLDAACAQLMAWRPTLELVSVAVNVSAITLISPNFVDRVQEIIQRYGVRPDLIKIEVTESVLMSNTEEMLERMNALVARGVRFSIDDFGTGYSSLGYLKRFPFNQLKIDRSFIEDVPMDQGSAALVRSMIAIGHNLGIRVIAEGVETLAQLEFLRTAGCDEMQGYYYSRPLPPGDCPAFLERKSTGQDAAVLTL